MQDTFLESSYQAIPELCTLEHCVNVAAWVLSPATAWYGVWLIFSPLLFFLCQKALIFLNLNRSFQLMYNTGLSKINDISYFPLY